MRRARVLVLDGCGAGVAPDAAEFGDLDSPHTLLNVLKAAGALRCPNLQAVGYLASAGLAPSGLAGYSVEFGRLQPLSKGGKDSVTGHWEMMGITLAEPFPTYPNGFPADLVARFCEAIGREVIGNKPASGTAIISELGEEHVRTGKPILYTSADSVFQVAAHEDVIPISELYRYCETARGMCEVQRVIARPFVGNAQEGFTRTDRRKDFPFEAPANLVDEIGEVVGIGVVAELFGGRGFLPRARTQNNEAHFAALREVWTEQHRFVFANFEDFDMRFGHRNDPVGFARCLEQFDAMLGQMLAWMGPDELLILTADHGNDPTTPSTDHSREYVPFCAITRGEGLVDLGDQAGFAQVGGKVSHFLQLHS